MTESLTKEERIQLSTQWPPDTKLFLKLLRAHDENASRVTELEENRDTFLSGHVAELKANQCTPEERNVLEAVKGLTVEQLRFFDDFLDLKPMVAAFLAVRVQP